jgi:hypothetical protein
VKAKKGLALRRTGAEKELEKESEGEREEEEEERERKESMRERARARERQSVLAIWLAVGAELCSLQTKPNRFRIAGKKGSFSGTRVVPEAMTPTACVSGVLFLVLYLTAPSRGQRFAGEPSFQPAASERKELTPKKNIWRDCRNICCRKLKTIS